MDLTKIANAHNKVVPKKDVEKFSFSELNIEKVKSFTQTPIKNFALAFFNAVIVNLVYH